MRETFHLVPVETFPGCYDDPGSPYPHIYGPIARSAILMVRRVDRDRNDRFAGLAVG